ncbi:MAG: hypothetical protein LBE61_13365 [Burkholderiaceae bacterium]|jgi:hypothetical protein|nr:hypothetical protein [Burkholderiaceae bacterium]
MKQFIHHQLLATCLALPLVAQAQVCTGRNATSNYIVGEAEGRASAMHWETGLVWSRCVQGASLGGGQCWGPILDQQKTWLDWISAAALLPQPFTGQGDWGIAPGLSENKLQTGAWRLPYGAEAAVLTNDCTGDYPLNVEVLPTGHGTGGSTGTFWSASPDPSRHDAAWYTDYTLSGGGQMIGVTSAKETRLVRGGQPFASLPAGPAPATAAAGTPFIFPAVTLASQSGSGAAWGGVRIDNGRLRVNGAGNWVREAIVKSGDQISVRLPAPATAGQQATATLTLRSGQTTGTNANAANSGAESTALRETMTHFAVTAAAAPVPRACRVSPTGNGDGTSWAQAASLADALADFSCSEIWLQRALVPPLYEPADARGFAIERNVKLYGGFVGSETTLAERPLSVAAASTVLTGQDTKRLLFLDGTLGIPLTHTLIDGLKLAQGFAGAEGGGALYCRGAGAGNACSPTLDNVTLEANNTQGNGGGMFNDGGNGGESSPVLLNVAVRFNTAQGSGGALYNRGAGGVSSPVLKNVYAERNVARGEEGGGALLNHASGSGGISNPVVEQSNFTDNKAETGHGGAIHSVTQDGGTSALQVSNTIFVSNSAGSQDNNNNAIGGAIAIFGAQTSAKVTHATFRENQFWTRNDQDPDPFTAGNSVYNQGGTMQVGQSLFWGALPRRFQMITLFGGTTTLTDSLLQDGCAGGNMAALGGTATCTGLTLDANPQLSQSLPAATSPALNTVACTLSTDQRGVTRPQGSQCDMGAVERLADHDLTIDFNGTGTGTVSGGKTPCTAHCTQTWQGETDPLQVTLTAAPSAGHTFTGWSGDCSGTGTCSVTMDRARSVQATFASPVRYTIGGTLSGLEHEGPLILHNNGGDGMALASDGAFTFSTPLAPGAAYDVTISVQPPGRTCVVHNGSGHANADVTDVHIACPPITYTVTASPASHLTCEPSAVRPFFATQCHANPPPGQMTQSISGCGGQRVENRNIFYTGPITSDCTVTATFAPVPTHTLGGTATGLTGTGLLLRNAGEDLPVTTSGTFSFTHPLADHSSYAVTIAAQPTGQRCTIANASGSNVTANVSNVQVACTPYFEGTTVPASGTGGTGSATFTGGGGGCRFDLASTRFEAAPTPAPPGHTLPQGVLRIGLVDCSADPVAMEVTWPETVAGYTKHGLATRNATGASYFAPAGLAISGRTVRFTLTDGQQGDDDWTVNGTIADPGGPTAPVDGTGAVQPVPTLGSGALALLGALLAFLALPLLRRSPVRS